MDPYERDDEMEDSLDEMPEGWEDDVFKIKDTPENVAKSLFAVNPNKEGFEWEYMKNNKQSDRQT